MASGVIDQPHAEGAQPCLDPVTVVSRARDIEAELVALEIGGAAEEEPPAGSLGVRLHLPPVSRADRVRRIANTSTLHRRSPCSRFPLLRRICQTRTPLPRNPRRADAIARDKLRWFDGLIGSKPFITGDELTMADIFLFAFRRLLCRPRLAARSRVQEFDRLVWAHESSTERCRLVQRRYGMPCPIRIGPLDDAQGDTNIAPSLDRRS